MAEQQAFVIEDYFSEGTNRVQHEEASSPMNKNSDSGIEAASIKPGDEQRRENSGAVAEEQEEKNASHEEHGNKLQKQGVVEDNPPQGPPAAKGAADFLPFRRAVIDTDTLLE